MLARMAKIVVEHIAGKRQVIDGLNDPTVVNDGTAYTVFDSDGSGPPSKFVATFPLKQIQSIERQD